jgi:signal peptidase I
MNGSGAGNGSSPPWGPADPVPELADTQAISGGITAHRAGGNGSTEGNSSARGNASARGDASARANAGSGDGDEADGPDDGSGSDQDSPADAPAGKRRRSFWRELPVLVVIAVVLALLIKSFVIQAFYIPSASMENTLEIGDRVLINKVVYDLRSIHRGDIIVFDGTNSWDFNTPPSSSNIFAKAVDELEGIVGVSHDSSIYIKRVIGLPGDHVACCNSMGQVTVNGVPLTEGSYLYPDDKPSTQAFHVTVPAGDLWVMGDHRSVSYDSRGHMGDPGGGAIPETGVLGRAFVILWPPSRWGFLNIPATFEQPQLNASGAAGGNAAAGGSSTALEAAVDNGTPVRPATSPLPLALGFAGAVPLTWLQRRVRLRSRVRPHRRVRLQRRDRRARARG